MDTNQFRDAAHSVVEEIIQYYDALPEKRVVSNVEPGYLRPQLPAAAPEDGQPWSEIQPDIDRLIMPGLTHWQHPKFMAFYPANASFPGILGEMYSSAFTAAAFNWICSPAITELETIMLDWVAEMLNLPESYLSKGKGGGIIQGTASEVVTTVMVAARERALNRVAEGLEGEAAEDKKDTIRTKLVALGSEQAHSSTQKGATIAGTKFRPVSVYKTDGYSMRGATVKSVLEQARSKGLIPYYLTVSLGTTGVAAIDSFEEIAELKKEWPDLWIHVDAAYAGAALALPEYQHLTKSFDSFDSFNVNLHKWMLTNFDCSAMYVRERSNLTDAFTLTPSYLRSNYGDSGLVTDYRDWQIPLGRRFRALKVWFVLRTYGVKGIQAHLRKHIALGEYFAGLMKERADLFQILTGPAFALTVFNVLPKPKAPLADGAEQALLGANHVTEKVYQKVISDGELFLTSAVIDGIYAIRLVSGSPSAEEKYLKRAFDILVEAAEKIREE